MIYIFEESDCYQDGEKHPVRSYQYSYIIDWGFLYIYRKFIRRCKIARNAHNMIHAIVLRITLFHRDSTVLITPSTILICIKISSLSACKSQFWTFSWSQLYVIHVCRRFGWVCRRRWNLECWISVEKVEFFKILEFLDAVRLTNSSSKCWESAMIL